MKLEVKYDRDEYDETDISVIPQPDLKPVLESSTADIVWHFNRGNNLSTDLVESLFLDYIHNNDNISGYDENHRKTVLEYGGIAKASTDKIEIKSPQELFTYFNNCMYFEDCIYFDNGKRKCQEWEYDECYFGGYKVFIYPNAIDDKVYPVPEARQAIMSGIFVRGNIVSYYYDNVHKYYGWDELLTEVMDIPYCNVSPERVRAKEDCDEGDTYSFILLTDNEALYGVTNILSSAIAGILTNHKTKTKTILNKHQAVHIWYWLFLLCQQYVDVWLERHYDSASEKIPIDTIEEYNPYVHEYFRRLELVDSLDNLEYLMLEIGGVCYDSKRHYEYDYAASNKVYHTDSARRVDEYLQSLENMIK